MNPRKYPLRYAITRKAVSTTFEYVELPPVPVGQVWVIHSHSFENETGARDDARAYIRRGGQYHWLWDESDPTKERLYWSEDEVALAEGDILGVRQEGNAAGDILQLKAHGVVIFDSEKQVV
ncbi:hypothetical protein ES708_21792 [subsurface metagenome]